MRLAGQRVRYVEEEVLGECSYPDRKITINPHQSARERLDTMIHETLHMMCPKWTEEEIIAASFVLGEAVWRDGYRRSKRGKV